MLEQSIDAPVNMGKVAGVTVVTEFRGVKLRTRYSWQRVNTSARCRVLILTVHVKSGPERPLFTASDSMKFST